MFQNRKEEKKITSTIQHDMELEYGDETKIVVTCLQGKSSSDCVIKDEPAIIEKKRSELFHIRVISKHTKFDTLFNSGSQANLISE